MFSCEQSNFISSLVMLHYLLLHQPNANLAGSLVNVDQPELLIFNRFLACSQTPLMESEYTNA